MNDDSSDSTDASLPLPVIERIDRICFDFEAAWKAGRTPRVEEYLGETRGAERSQLLQDLLLLDLDYRRQEAEQPTPEEYHARFSNDAKLVDDAFRQFSTCAASSPAPGTKVRYLGDYELLEEIARGGMGVVYRARQISLNRTVAVKMILKGHLATEEDVKRFQTEAEAAANLQHPNIVAIHEVGVHDGQHYFSMDYVEGTNLAEMVRENPLPPRRAAQYVRTIAEAIYYAHQEGTLHRDLKPANVLIDQTDQPRVTDFGLAKRSGTGQKLTATGQPLGTLSYMPPEQAIGRWDEVQPASDIYSLGAILYELATRRPPFRAATEAETQRQVINNEPVPPRRLNPAIDRDLETICLKCLEKEPKRRYSTAEELANELQRYEQGRPIHARPITRPTRAWRWCKRNRTVASLASIAASLLLVLSVGGPIVAAMQIGLRQKADEEAARANKYLGQQTELLDEKTRLLKENEIERRRAVAGENLAEAEAAKALAAKRAAVNAQRETRRTLYVADMNRIQEYWEIPNLGVVRRLLNRYLPKPGEDDLRSFEWYYWWRLCHQDLMTLKHESEVQLVAISPDGKLLASASVGGVVKLWDLGAGEVKHTLPTFGNEFKSLAFSEDGKILAAANGHIRQIRMWDADSGDQLPLKGTPKGTPKQFTAMPLFRWSFAFSPNLTTYASSGRGGELTLRDLGTGNSQKFEGKFVGIYILGGKPGVGTLFGGTFNGSGRTARLYSPVDESSPRPREYGGPVFSIAFSQDGTTVAAGGREGTLKLWDVATGKLKGKGTLKGHTGIVWALAFSPDGKTLASAATDGMIVLWDVATGTSSMRFEGHELEVRSLAFLPDGHTLASTGADSTIKLWDLVTRKRKSTLKGHEGPINCVTCSADGRMLATAGADGRVKLWSTGEQDDRLGRKGFYRFDKVALSGDGRSVISALPGDRICVWDTATRQHRVFGGTSGRSSFRGSRYAQTLLIISHDGKTVATCGGRAALKLWNLADGAELATLGTSTTVGLPGKGIGQNVPGIGVAHDASKQGMGQQPLGRLALGQPYADPTLCAELSPDGAILASAHYNGTVKLWKVPAGKLTDTLEVIPQTVPSETPPLPVMLSLPAMLSRSGDRITSLTFSPDGSTLAVDLVHQHSKRKEPATGEVQLWSLSDAKKKTTLGDIAGGATATVYSPDGRLLARACSQVDPTTRRSNAIVKLWNAANSQLEQTVSIGQWQVRALAFLPHGKTLAIGCAAGDGWRRDGRVEVEVQLWDVTEGKQRTTIALEGKMTYFPSMVFSADCRTVAGASGDPNVRLWDVASGRVKASFGLPASPVFCVAFSPDERTLAVATRDGLNEPRGGMTDQGSDEQVELWDWVDREKRKSRRYGSFLEVKPSASFSPDGRLLYAGMVLQDLNSRKAWLLGGKEVDTILGISTVVKSRTKGGVLGSTTGSFAPEFSATFSPDGQTLASAGSDGNVKLWVAATGKPLGTLIARAHYCFSVAFSPDGKTLAAAADKTVQLWDVESRKLREVLRGHTDFVRCVVYSHDGETLASASSDGTVKLWDMPVDTLRATLRGHKGGVSFVAISPDDKTVASAGRDGTAKLWDLESGEEKATLRGHTRWVTSVAFSPAGRTLASASADGTVRLWKGSTDE